MSDEKIGGYVSSESFKAYVLGGCIQNPVLPKVIIGFARHQYVKDQEPDEPFDDLEKRQETIALSKRLFTLKTVNPVLEELEKDEKLVKTFKDTRKGTKAFFSLPISN